MIILLTCYYIRCLAVHELNKAFCDTGGFTCQVLPPQVLVALSDALGIFLKPVVWMCLSLEGWSHRDGRTEATFTHIDESSSQWDIAFCTQSQLAVRKLRQLQAYVFSTSLYSLIPTHRHTHTHPYTPPHTYLFIIFMHTYAYLKTPHRTCDCSKTILYSYEKVSALSGSPSISLIWIQNN